VPTVNSPAIAVLCVDDNPQVLQAVKAALTTAGYAVEVAASGWSALQRLRTARDRLRVVVTDIRMPEMTGVRMIRQSRALDIAARSSFSLRDCSTLIAPA
jgi:CheY-like chemotaxis protein